jgi:hypothetical protein
VSTDKDHVSVGSVGRRGSMGVGSALEFGETNGEDVMGR